MLPSLIEQATLVIWVAAAVCGGLSALFALAIIWVSTAHYIQNRLNSELDAKWSDWLLSCHFYPTPAPWAKTSRQQAYMASKWVKLLLSYTGEHRAEISQKAQESGLFQYVADIIGAANKKTPQTLEACVTLIGLLRIASLTYDVKQLIKSPLAPVSFAAAVALVRMDSSQFSYVWQNLRLKELSKSALLTLLNEGSPREVDAAMRKRLEVSNPREAAQLLIAWDQIPGCSARVYSTKLLMAGQEETWLLSAALRLQSNPQNLPLVRKYLEHENWGVRLNAVKALGAMGYGDDEAVLMSLEDNPNWWVRTRAREQLKELSFAAF